MQITIECSEEQFTAWKNAASQDRPAETIDAWILRMLDSQSTQIAIDGIKIARLDYARRLAGRAAGMGGA